MIVEFTSLLPVSLDSSKSLRNFVRAEYKKLLAARLKRVDSRFAQDANDYTKGVQSKVSRLLVELSREFKPGQVDMLNMLARDVDEAIQLFQKDHTELSQLPPIALQLESKLKNLAKKDPAPPPKVVVVYSYPAWATTSEQRAFWETASNIANDYFRARTELSKTINWSQARTDSSYLLRSDIQWALSTAITRRREMIARLDSVDRSDGEISNLSAYLRQMLNDSVMALEQAKAGNYSSFKSLNDANNKLQTYIRRTFGIR